MIERMRNICIGGKMNTLARASLFVAILLVGCGTTRDVAVTSYHVTRGVAVGSYRVATAPVHYALRRHGDESSTKQRHRMLPCPVNLCRRQNWLRRTNSGPGLKARESKASHRVLLRERRTRKQRRQNQNRRHRRMLPLQEGNFPRLNRSLANLDTSLVLSIRVEDMSM